jgi:hypothetical protein
MAHRSSKRVASGSKTKGEGVGYFDHFPKNYLRPYGATTTGLEDSTIFRRLIPSCCEFLKWPKVAFSEFAETVSETINALETMDNPLLDAKQLSSLKKTVRKINNSLAKKNTKDNSTATAEEVKQAVRSLLEPNDEVDIIAIIIAIIGKRICICRKLIKI